MARPGFHLQKFLQLEISFLVSNVACQCGYISVGRSNNEILISTGSIDNEPGLRKQAHRAFAFGLMPM
jgi:hypothetical protein